MGNTNSKTSDSKSDQPPSYDVIDSPESRIKALDVPQWKWSNAECRIWLRKFLIEQCGRIPGHADRVVEGLDGFGANLYLRSKADWRKLTYLNRVDADGIYVLLLGYRKKKWSVIKECSSLGPEVFSEGNIRSGGKG